MVVLILQWLGNTWKTKQWQS